MTGKRLAWATGWIMLLWLGTSLWGLGQEPAPVSDARVSLENHAGKTEFYVGDRVVVDLVFRAAAGSPYGVNGTLYGDIAEKVEISPEKGWIEWQGRSGHDYASIVRVGEREFRVPVVLNEGFVLREAGHYEVKVTTGRLEGVPAAVTNTVGIDLNSMPEDVEKALVAQLAAELAGPAQQTRQGYQGRADAYSRLAALTGDDALQLKMKLIREEDEGFRNYEREALASTRDLPAELKLLEEIWNDPKQDPVYDLLGDLAETHRLMRGETMPGWQMVLMPKEPTEAQKAEARETAEYIESLIRSLPARSGENRTDAFYLLFETMPLTEAQRAALRAGVVEEFPHMDATQQAMLLQTRWDAVRDPALAPVLKASLDERYGQRDTRWALQRLVELDPVMAKPYVIREICKPNGVVILETVRAMPQATLPEVDACLGQILRTPPASAYDLPWQWKAELAGRFATEAIVPDVRAGWRFPQQDGAALAVLLRYRPAEAVALLRDRGDVKNPTALFEIGEVFTARKAAYPKELLSYLRELTKGTDRGQEGLGMYQLANHGTMEDEALLIERLEEVRLQARADGGREEEGRWNALSPAAGLEVEIFGDLRNATAWKMSNEEAAALAEGCLSKPCREFGKPH